jgi:hypothetical protein
LGLSTISAPRLTPLIAARSSGVLPMMRGAPTRSRSAGRKSAAEGSGALSKS